MGTQLPFTVEGVSIAGQETCIILPHLKLAFDIGRCPQRSVYTQLLLLSHSHLDHIGGLPFHASSRALLKLPPTTVILPSSISARAEQFLEASRSLDQSDIPCKLISLDVGSEHRLASNHVVRPFNTFHRVPSQGYLVYSRRSMLKPNLQGKAAEEIRQLRLAGQEVTNTVELPEVAFTGDTTAAFITHPGNHDVLRARLLIMELTFLDNSVTVQHAEQETGHMHIDRLVEHADKFQNEAILLIHFSARYSADYIQKSLEARLPDCLRDKCIPLLNGFHSQTTERMT